MIPAAVLLSVCIGVAGCGCPSSSRVTLNGNMSCAFINNDPISASAADDITDFIILASTYIGAFKIFDLPSLLPKYVNPPARDLASLATRYAASEWLYRIMSLARYTIFAFGFDAQ